MDPQLSTAIAGCSDGGNPGTTRTTPMETPNIQKTHTSIFDFEHHAERLAFLFPILGFVLGDSPLATDDSNLTRLDQLAMLESAKGDVHSQK